MQLQSIFYSLWNTAKHASSVKEKVVALAFVVLKKEITASMPNPESAYPPRKFHANSTHFRQCAGAGENACFGGASQHIVNINYREKKVNKMYERGAWVLDPGSEAGMT